MLPLKVPSDFACVICEAFFPTDRGLRPEGLHPSRGVAVSGFPPLDKIPDCCLPQESGPCLSPSVADHPLRPAIHRSLGEPLPHQQANGTRTHPWATAFMKRPSFFPHRPKTSWAYPVLAVVSNCYSEPRGRLSTRYSPVRHSTHTRRCFLVRLACLKHAASVRSEPGSNSPV